MPPVQLLIKPASSNCNLRCEYCFYTDIAQNREQPSHGIMSTETLETIVRRTFAHATGGCSFIFQGGEPTLAGLDFYRALIAFERQYNLRKIPVEHSIQTNGVTLDDEWCEFLHDHQFLVGLSLDGVKDIHDRWRVDAAGKGSYSRVLHAAQLLDKHRVEFNLLTVVTAQTARSVEKIYGAFQRGHWAFQQYVPCLDPIGESRGRRPYSLTPELYEQFLKRLFDLWYRDLARGQAPHIRYFENLVQLMRGNPPESCGMAGVCSRQLVVEANADVYPCDFYVLDRYRLGNLCTDRFEALEAARDRLEFIEQSRQPAPRCLACRWRQLCRGGCRRDREDPLCAGLSLNYFCAAYDGFFTYAIERLCNIAQG